MPNLNKQRGASHETRVRNRREGRRKVPLSGAGEIKGDVLSDVELIQCKSSAQTSKTLTGRGAKQITVKLADLLQMQAEQKLEGKPIGIMHLHYKGERKDWVVMSEEQYELFLDCWFNERYRRYGV